MIFNLNTQGFVYLDLVEYQVELNRNVQVFANCNICISGIHTDYENMPIQIYLKFYQQKKMKIFRKNSDIFHISTQNIDCRYPQSMFLSRNKKNNVYPCKPQFYYT